MGTEQPAVDLHQVGRVDDPVGGRGRPGGEHDVVGERSAVDLGVGCIEDVGRVTVPRCAGRHRLLGRHQLALGRSQLVVGDGTAERRIAVDQEERVQLLQLPRPEHAIDHPRHAAPTRARRRRSRVHAATVRRPVRPATRGRPARARRPDCNTGGVPLGCQWIADHPGGSSRGRRRCIAYRYGRGDPTGRTDMKRQERRR